MENGEVKESRGDSRRLDSGVAGGDVTHGCRVVMSANHTEGEKQKDNALKIGHDGLLD